jgi:hypothetical protein
LLLGVRLLTAGSVACLPLEAKVKRYPEPSYAFDQPVSFLKLIPQAVFCRDGQLRPFETIDQYFISWVRHLKVSLSTLVRIGAVC